MKSIPLLLISLVVVAGTRAAILLHSDPTPDTSVLTDEVVGNEVARTLSLSASTGKGEVGRKLGNSEKDLKHRLEELRRLIHIEEGMLKREEEDD